MILTESELIFVKNIILCLFINAINLLYIRRSYIFENTGKTDTGLKLFIDFLSSDL